MNKTTYIPIGKNTYFNGYSYRTRVRINGKTVSYNDTDQKRILKVRDKLFKIKE